MAEQIPGIEERRPAVQILVCDAPARIVDPILWGLEEEGVPPEVQNVPNGDTVSLARQAAHMSTLNVGIAVNAREDRVVLHHRDLAAHPPLVDMPLHEATTLRLRLLGSNAARLVKVSPLLFEEDLEGRRSSLPPVLAHQLPAAHSPAASQPPVSQTTSPALTAEGQAALLDLVVRTVLEILGNEQELSWKRA